MYRVSIQDLSFLMAADDLYSISGGSGFRLKKSRVKKYTPDAAVDAEVDAFVDAEFSARRDIDQGQVSINSSGIAAGGAAGATAATRNGKARATARVDIGLI
jgi:hypothetical protein